MQIVQEIHLGDFSEEALFQASPIKETSENQASFVFQVLTKQAPTRKVNVPNEQTFRTSS